MQADSPAVIDPNAVLSRSIPCQLLQAVGRRNLQIVEGTSVVDHAQFTQGNLLDIGRQPAGALAGKIVWVSRSLKDLITRESYNASR
jgi:hypothetical protein